MSHLRVCALFSGGKDSTYALWCAIQQGWEMACLLNIRPKSAASWMFHHPAVEWTNLQAEAMGLPLEVAEVTGEKDREIAELEKILHGLRKKHELDGVVSGALESEYQRTKIDLVCDGASLRSFTPLWRKGPRRVIAEEVASGFEIVVTSCSAMGLTEAWLGKRLDQSALEQLDRIAMKTGINVAFEGGEAETFVLDGPLFKRRVRIVRDERIWSGDAGQLKILEAKLSER
jgi:ABC transporter with metal-binding/Fe-S-binding domain ATP-binding protein